MKFICLYSISHDAPHKQTNSKNRGKTKKTSTTSKTMKLWKDTRASLNILVE